jgi:Arc/MetJ-type ribon-helix-helix transcriptional regulator
LAKRDLGKDCHLAILEAETVMATMNISLPDAVKDWVEAQAETGFNGNSSDVVRDLIRTPKSERQKLRTCSGWWTRLGRVE